MPGVDRECTTHHACDCIQTKLERLEAEVARLTEERDEKFRQWYMAALGVDEEYNPPCKRCGGLGRRAYGDTSTWHGGIGGQTITTDVCDGCWGSGSKNAPWPSHREMEQKWRAIERELDQQREDIGRL